MVDAQIDESLRLANALMPPFDQEIATGNSEGRARVQALVVSLQTQESLLQEVFCPPGQEACAAAPTGGEPEIEARLFERVVVYSMLLAVPARQRYDDDVVLRGKQLFGELQCASCHVPSHDTTGIDGFPELADQRIWPYTDLLLHDMGEELSDGRPSFEADGREWRTPPLWGLRFYAVVNGHDRLMHDVRARGVAEAILWHGGEAEASRELFRALPRADREALIEFVESL